MLKKVWRWGIYLLILGAVAVTPAAFYSGPQWWAHWTNAMSRSPAEESPEPAGSDLALPQVRQVRSLDSQPISAIEEVLRFDVTPA